MKETIDALTTQRVNLDAIKKSIEVLPASRGKALAFTSLEKGRMWVGEVCRELGKEYPYESTKSATTAAEIVDAVDVVDINNIPVLVETENEITALNSLREVLDDNVTTFLQHIDKIKVPKGIDGFKMNCAVSEAYRGLKEARMWLGIRLGEIRDNAK